MLVILVVIFASGCAQKGANETGGGVGNAGQNATNASTFGKNDKNLMQILSDEKYTTLVKLIDASGMKDTLVNGGQYTIFAPTDKAFNALPTGTIDALMSNTTELRRVLSYHITNGEVTEQDLSRMTGIQTLGGKVLPVKNSIEGLQVGNAKITDTDTRPSNGIIHQIDTVLIPPR